MSSSYAGMVYPVNPMRVTDRFGETDEYYSPTNPHKGVDIAPRPGSYGEPVRSPLDGEVYAAVRSTRGFGNYVALKHTLPSTIYARDLAGTTRAIGAGEPFYLIYAHLQTLKVSQGARVQGGDIIGTIGNTGYSFGPHVHLEARIGNYAARTVVDPEDIFRWYLVGYDANVTYA